MPSSAAPAAAPAVRPAWPPPPTPPAWAATPPPGGPRPSAAQCLATRVSPAPSRLPPDPLSLPPERWRLQVEVPPLGVLSLFVPRRRCRTSLLRDYRVQEYRVPSPPSFKCNVLRESLSVDSQNIPCATLKSSGSSWVIAVYLCFPPFLVELYLNSGSNSLFTFLGFNALQMYCEADSIYQLPPIVPVFMNVILHSFFCRALQLNPGLLQSEA